MTVKYERIDKCLVTLIFENVFKANAAGMMLDDNCEEKMTLLMIFTDI